MIALRRFLPGILVAVLLFFVCYRAGGVPITLVELSLLAFWFAVLPGTLLLHRLLDKSLQRLETWCFGAALGVGFMPGVALLLGQFMDNMSTIWSATYVLISIFDLIGIYWVFRRRNVSKDADYTLIPALFLSVFVIALLAFYQFHEFWRDDSSGVYRFSHFFGGDIPTLSAFAECLSRSPILVDFHNRSLPVIYHDNIFRFEAGLFHIVGGDIYQTTWYWLEPFSFFLIFACLFVISTRITESRIAGFLTLFGLLLFDNITRYEHFYFAISDSFRFGLLQAFLIIYFLLEAHRHRTNHGNLAKILIPLTTLIILVVRWKVTLVMVLLPVLVLTEFINGRSSKDWRIFYSILIGSVVAAVYAFIFYYPNQALGGETVIGRPFLGVVRNLELLLKHRLPFSPIAPISQFGWRNMIAFIVLLPLQFLKMLIFSMRYTFIFFVLPFIPLPGRALPHSKFFFIAMAAMGYLALLLQSPMHYIFGDIYQPNIGLEFSLIPLAFTIEYLIRNRREMSGIRTRIIQVVVLLTIAVDAFYGFTFLQWDRSLRWGTFSSGLVNDLGKAGRLIPEHSLVVTRRYDLFSPNPNQPLPAHPEINGVPHDRNFGFYATSLSRPVVLESVIDNMRGAPGLVEVDSNIYYFPNPAMVKDLWQTSRLVDSIYDSRSDTIVTQSMHALQASYVLLDKTSNQSLHASVVADTVYSTSTMTLLHIR